MKKLLAMLLATLLLGVGALGLAGCGPKTYGTFYTLQEAYDNGYLTREDLLNIAYHNGDRERNESALQNFEPTPIGELSEEISLKIREYVAESYRNKGYNPDVTAEHVSITNYLGCYNGYYVFRYLDNLTDRPAVDRDPEAYVQEVAGIKFCYYKTSMIFLWKDN